MARTLLLLAIVALFLSGCAAAIQDTYFDMWEKVGVEKREILVDRVQAAQETQQEAQQEFASALDELSALINFDGGDLDDVYRNVNDKYESSRDAAAEVTNRIDKVQSVADALFREWATELDLISSANLKRDSQKKLKETMRRYASLLKSMRKVESSMKPVLNALSDNVLYLKHNLNANAIGALQGEFTTIKRDVNLLINEMNAAISQSDEFITSLQN
jgi:hypothetical protein